MLLLRRGEGYTFTVFIHRRRMSLSNGRISPQLTTVTIRDDLFDDGAPFCAFYFVFLFGKNLFSSSISIGQSSNLRAVLSEFESKSLNSPRIKSIYATVLSKAPFVSIAFGSKRFFFAYGPEMESPRSKHPASPRGEAPAR